MSDDSCNCCGGVDEQDGEITIVPDRWIGDAPVLDAALPRDLRSALGQFLGREPVETLGEWAAEVRSHTGGGSIPVEDLCLTDDETDHWGTLDGERYYFACFYDAVILAALTDRPVDVRTKSPDGEVIEARAVGTTDLTVVPTEAVVSFGIDDAVTPPSADGPTLERGYAAICPYVRAFTDRDAYAEWAGTVPAATVAMPLAGATELASELARRDPIDG